MAKTMNKKSGGVAIGRYGWLSFGMLVIFVGIIYCIIKIKYVEGGFWRELGLKQTVMKDRAIRPNRGNIFADDGRLLATSEPLYAIYMDFMADGIVEDSLKNNLDALCNILGRKYPGRTSAQYKKVFLDNWNLSRREVKLVAQAKKDKKPHPRLKTRYVRIIKEQLNYLELKELRTFPFFNQRSNRSGLLTEELTMRLKPFGRLAGRTVGSIYKDIDAGGSSGLELKYNDLLKGSDGIKTRKKNGGRWIDVIMQEPIDGIDIETTLNVDYQDIAEKALYAKLAEISAESGCAIVMEVATGEIKAIANLDRIADGVYAEGRPNAFSYMSEPGSTFKAISLLIALEDGVVTPETVIDAGTGLYQYAGRTVRDHDAHKSRDKSAMTIREGMYNSSNVVMAKMILKGYENKPNQFIERIHELGLGKSLEWDVPLQGIEGTTNIRFPDDKKNPWSKTTLPWMAFGYETQVPPIYMLMFYNGIANDGRMLKPFITKAFWENGKKTKEFKADVISYSLASNKTLKQVQDVLRGVVTDGTGRAVDSKIVSIAGKTGTAQIAAEGRYNSGHYVSFVGYFPAEKPKYTCFVGIRRPRGIPSGGGMPGAVFKNIAEGITVREMVSDPILAPVDTLRGKLPNVKGGMYKNIEMVLSKLGQNYTEPHENGAWVRTKTDNEVINMTAYDIKTKGIMPNVIGMGIKDAVYLLENEGLIVRVTGSGKVRSQSIAAGSRFTNGSRVLLELN